MFLTTFVCPQGSIYSPVVQNAEQVSWPLTPKNDRATRPFYSTSDIGPSDMRQGGKNYSDMGHGLFSNSTFDMGINKRQRRVTLAFLKIDMRHGDPSVQCAPGLLHEFVYAPTVHRG